MKALTTLMAILSFLTLASFNEAPTYTGSESSETLATARFASLAASDRPTPATAQPWFADYPLTTDIAGARVYASEQARVDQVRWALERFAAEDIALTQRSNAVDTRVVGSSLPVRGR